MINNINISTKPNWLGTKIEDLDFSRGRILFKKEKISWQEARKFRSENIYQWEAYYNNMSSIEEYYVVYNDYYTSRNKYVKGGLSVSDVCTDETDKPKYIIKYSSWSNRLPDQDEQYGEEIIVYEIV